MFFSTTDSCLDIVHLSCEKKLDPYRIAQNFGGENFSEFGETNAIRQYLPCQIPGPLK